MKVLGREVAGGKESSAFFGSTHRTLVRVGGVLLGLTNCSNPCNILLALSFTLSTSQHNEKSTYRYTYILKETKLLSTHPKQINCLCNILRTKCSTSRSDKKSQKMGNTCYQFIAVTHKLLLEHYVLVFKPESY